MAICRDSASYEDLADHPKVEDRDCVVVDFFVKGDRSGGPVDGRVIEGNSSCRADVELYEQLSGTFSEASRIDDVFGDKWSRGVEDPEGW